MIQATPRKGRNKPAQGNALVVRHNSEAVPGVPPRTHTRLPRTVNARGIPAHLFIVVVKTGKLDVFAQAETPDRGIKHSPSGRGLLRALNDPAPGLELLGELGNRRLTEHLLLERFNAHQ
jgi:hypothetical protein